MNDQHGSKKQRFSRRGRLVGIVGLVALGAIVLAACGGGGGGKAAANGMAAMDMPAQSGAHARNTTPVGTNSVKIDNFAFSPATVRVKVGATIVWTNDDAIQHDVTFDGGTISSGVLNHGDTFSHTFTTAGTYHYICSIHPFMHGTVIVTG